MRHPQQQPQRQGVAGMPPQLAALRRHVSSAAFLGRRPPTLEVAERPEFGTVKRLAPNRPPPPALRKPAPDPPPPVEVYVSSASRVCLAGSPEGLDAIGLPMSPRSKVKGFPADDLPVKGVQLRNGRHIERKVESQEVHCWIEGESDGDDLAEGHHYEALYEVIKPRLAVTLDHADDSYDDSFDSDDATEEVAVRGLDVRSDTSRERPGSGSGSERSKESEDPSLRSQKGITRLAEAAGAQMRRLRRNWSVTKTDIGRSITRIKKRSTVSAAEVNLALNQQQQTKALQQTDAAVAAPVEKKGTWALRHIRRRITVATAPLVVPNQRSLASSSSLGNKKDASTFYLTLTIEPDESNSSQCNNNNSSKKRSTSEASVICSSSSTSSTSSSTSSSSPPPPLIHPHSTTPSPTKDIPPRPQRTSSASSLTGMTSAISRPKTAPPDPPARAPSGNIPPKKPLSRLTPPIHPDKILSVRETQYCDIDVGPVPGATGKVSGEPDELTVAWETPYSRLSHASRRSSETYIVPAELNAAATSTPDDGRSYIDLEVSVEAEEQLYVSSHFADEPLYQFYTADIMKRAAHNQGEVSEEDDYEVIGEHRTKELSQTEDAIKTDRLPSAMELLEGSSGRRTLWCELPQVINSGLLEKITPQQRKLQEAMFELITSEASYLRSLNVLTSHFIQSVEFSGLHPESSVLSRMERQELFADVLPVRDCSEALLADLEKRWQQNVLISDICDILLEHATQHFDVYVKYCTNQLSQERKLRELKAKKPQFVEVLKRLESSPVCQSLAMHSFLMLPMQRITRLPLLVDAIFNRLESSSPEYERCRFTLAMLNKIVQECNEGARKAERIHEMLVVSNQLDFGDVKSISIMSASRWLVKKGELQRLMWRDMEARLTFGRKVHKQTVYVFLFTDLLVITKKKGEELFTVLDYCPRNMVQVEEHIRMDKGLGKAGSELGKNLILLTMLQNHENKTVEMVMACSSESDRTRWLEAVTPRISDNPEEKIYEEWDCPQVQAIHPYVATQPDELSLELTNVVNVLRKMADDSSHHQPIIMTAL